MARNSERINAIAIWMLKEECTPRLGKTPQEIATEFGISLQTARNVLRHSGFTKCPNGAWPIQYWFDPANAAPVAKTTKSKGSGLLEIKTYTRSYTVPDPKEQLKDRLGDSFRLLESFVANHEKFLTKKSMESNEVIKKALETVAKFKKGGVDLDEATLEDALKTMGEALFAYQLYAAILTEVLNDPRLKTPAYWTVFLPLEQ